MALKKLKPVTEGQRGRVAIDRRGLYRGKPLKSLTEGKRRISGRNVHGRITVRRRGGGHKKRYRVIDFKRDRFDLEATVVRLEYDPNRTAFIALLSYDDGTLSYILAPHRLTVGSKVISSREDVVDPLPGNAMMLGNIPVGTSVHNVEMHIGKGGQLARSAGGAAQILGRVGDHVQLRLMSGEVRLIHRRCRATVGVLSNLDQKNTKLGKAGRSRWLGRRPSVRGVAMNPVDHPHGGGEGKTSGGRHPVSPWGKPTKGARTRGKKPSDKWIVRRRTVRR